MRRIRAKFEGPRHPWEKGRIEEEKRVVYEYGLKNKREIWKLDSQRKRATSQAKKLIAATGTQAEREKKQLLSRLHRMGILSQNAGVDDVLGLTLNDFLIRRLQTLLVKKGLARTMHQARQFITHQHVQVAGKMITSPSYLVLRDEESQIVFVASSSLSNTEHPERSGKQKPAEAKSAEAKPAAAASAAPAAPQAEAKKPEVSA